ncbi:DinB family protein [Paenibacillus lautus]|uniref:DinB family protein n=1 Tax=Paenibacillus lautus TaxID=1401 RepID=UPI003D2E9792
MRLEDITFEQAIWKPVDAMNSIWELVCHLLFYEKRLLMRFLDETANEPQAEDNKSTFRLPLHDAYHIGQIVFLSKIQGAVDDRSKFS